METSNLLAMQEPQRKNAVTSSRPYYHPQVRHMTKNLSGMPEAETPWLETHARVAEEREEAFARLVGIVLLLLPWFYTNSTG